MNRIDKIGFILAAIMAFAIGLSRNASAGEAMDELRTASVAPLDQTFDNNSHAPEAVMPSDSGAAAAGAQNSVPAPRYSDGRDAANPGYTVKGLPQRDSDEKPSDMKLGLFAFLGMAIGAAIATVCSLGATGFIGLGVVGFILGTLVADGTIRLTPKKDPENLPGKTPGSEGN